MTVVLLRKNKRTRFTPLDWSSILEKKKVAVGKVIVRGPLPPRRSSTPLANIHVCVNNKHFKTTVFKKKSSIKGFCFPESKIFIESEGRRNN